MEGIKDIKELNTVKDINELVRKIGLSKTKQIAYYYLVEIVMQGYENGYCLGIEDYRGQEYEITVKPVNRGN